MGPTPDQIQLIRDYEPALFFVGNMGSPGAERFFPSDAKRYLEKAALYRINAADETKAQWGNPVLGAGTISGAPNEDGTFIGAPDTSIPPKFPFLATDPDKELFFDVSGWKPGNRFADLNHMAALYAGELNDSQFRYHAEFFDADRLRLLFDSPGNAQFAALFDPRPGKPPVLTDPALICYYLFYPAHEESLGGCTDIAGNLLESARDFGSFAGEWSCIAILFDRANAAQLYDPKWVGLTNRNTGQINVGTGEVRSTMRILPWSAMLLYETTHSQFNVGIGSHGLYVNGESLPVISFTDPTAVNCGEAGPILVPGDAIDPKGWIIFSKAWLGLVAAGPIGAAAGAIWGIAETPSRVISLATPELTYPDSVSSTGFVIYPQGKPPPGVQPGDPTRSAEWKSDPLDIGNRHYDFTVDRATQPFWGEDPDGHGYTGRWGPRVEGDTLRRRTGMSFPKFWQLFFSSLVSADPPSRTILLTSNSGTTWTVPSDWNSAANSIECIGGGGGGGGGSNVTFRAGGGGGGAEYRKATNVTLTPGASVPVSVGAGGIGGPANTDGAGGGDTIFNTNTVIAKGGGGGGGDGGSGSSGRAGAAGTGGTGDVANSGGHGGTSSGIEGTNGAGGGGGAGGPLGAGGAGGDNLGSRGSAGGGGGNGGGAAGAPGVGGSSPLAGGAGGNNNAGAGGGAGGMIAPVAAPAAGISGGGGGGGALVTPQAFSGATGGAGADLDASHGSGGGGGGACADQDANGLPGGDGGNYGAGGGGGSQARGTSTSAGGNGADGIIVIRYTPPF